MVVRTVPNQLRPTTMVVVVVVVALVVLLVAHGVGAGAGSFFPFPNGAPLGRRAGGRGVGRRRSQGQHGKEHFRVAIGSAGAVGTGVHCQFRVQVRGCHRVALAPFAVHGIVVET